MKNKIIFFISIVMTIFFAEYVANAAVTLPTDSGLPSNSGGIATIVSNVTNWLLSIFGFLAIISFVVSGIMYFLAAGDEKSQEKAKKQMQWSITGVVVGLVGLVIIYTVDLLLRGS